MKDIAEILKNEYDVAMRGGATNDHDRIARVRPIHLLRACSEIYRLRDELAEADACPECGERALWCCACGEGM